MTKERSTKRWKICT